jgi:hypothetical protein
MRWLLVILLAISCHHEATPAKPQPGDTPPLPPASGTPIGYLVDARTTLALREDQVTKLKDLDTTLAARLEALDAQARGAAKPANAGGDAPMQPRRGGRGRHGGGRRGGAGSGSASPKTTSPARTHIDQERSATVRDALQQAFALLDATQQTAARKLLAEHDVDVDAAIAPPQSTPDEEGSDEGSDETPPAEP